VQDWPPPEERAALRGASARSLHRALTGDLDLIVATALRGDPDARYATADELAADVKRHLDEHPIRAHPESATYRLRKFVTRHPFFIPGVVAAVVALGAFIGMLEIQNRRIAGQRDAAEVASRRASATQNFLVELLRSADPTTANGRDLTVEQAMQRGRQRAQAELQGQPDLHAAVLEAMGRTFTGLGRFETADTLLRASLQLLVAHQGRNDERALTVGNLIGFNHRQSRNFVAADSVYHEVLRLRAMGPPAPDSVLAGLYTALSASRRELGDVDSSLALATRAVTLRRTARDSTSEEYLQALGGLAFALRGAERLDSAEVVYRDVLRGQEAANMGATDRALTLNNLGFLLRTRGDYAGAESSYRAAQDLLDEALGEGHATTMIVTNNLAAVLELAGKIDETVRLGQVRIEAVEREWPDGHWRVGNAHAALGRLLMRHGRMAQAEAPLRAAEQSYAATLGAQAVETVLVRLHLGVVFLASDRVPEGRTLFERSWSAIRRMRGASDADSRRQVEQLHAILLSLGDSARADRVRRFLPDAAKGGPGA
jgi:tetratricopeptide (TPR) repeat protein